MTTAKPCPECGQKNLFVTTTSSGGGYGPMLLPKLGSFFVPAAFNVVVCAECGLTRFFASTEACNKLSTTAAWKRL